MIKRRKPKKTLLQTKKNSDETPCCFHEDLVSNLLMIENEIGQNADLKMRTFRLGSTDRKVALVFWKA